MSTKRVFVLNGHPAATSLSRALTEAYAQSARDAGHEVRLTHLHDLDFDIDFGLTGYSDHKALEQDLETFQTDLEWSQHVVLATPMWWGGLPAKLKGLIDRTFLPGWAFDTRITKMGLPQPMLGGRTARVIVTSDTPDFLFGLFYGKALLRQIKRQIFQFVGIKPLKVTHFSPTGKAKEKTVHMWIEQIRTIGARAA